MAAVLLGTTTHLCASAPPSPPLPSPPLAGWPTEGYVKLSGASITRIMFAWASPPLAQAAELERAYPDVHL